jgi:hypothetical protein
MTEKMTGNKKGYFRHKNYWGEEEPGNRIEPE